MLALEAKSDRPLEFEHEDEANAAKFWRACRGLLLSPRYALGGVGFFQGFQILFELGQL